MSKNRMGRVLKLLQDIIFGLIVVAFVAYAFQDEILGLPPEVSQPTTQLATDEVSVFAKTITLLPVTQLPKTLVTKDGKPTLMMVYASWCPYCRRLIPAILALKKEGKLENAHLLFLSIDKDKDALARYILAYGYQHSFEPIIVQSTASKTLQDVLIEKGSYYDGTIPRTLVFTGQGKLVGEMSGLVGGAQMLRKVEEAN